MDARFGHIENENRRTYAAMVWAMDRAIGKVIAELDSQGVTDNTLIWFLSDNGGVDDNYASNLPLAGAKGTKFEGGIRVPFILQWKQRFPKGRVFAPMVSALDIFPTSQERRQPLVARRMIGQTSPQVDHVIRN